MTKTPYSFTIDLNGIIPAFFAVDKLKSYLQFFSIRQNLLLLGIAVIVLGILTTTVLTLRSQDIRNRASVDPQCAAGCDNQYDNCVNNCNSAEDFDVCLAFCNTQWDNCMASCDRPDCVFSGTSFQCCGDGLKQSIDHYVWDDGSGTCNTIYGSCNIPDAACDTGPTTETSCNNFIDDDVDGATDCDDQDCFSDPACQDPTETPVSGACTGTLIWNTTMCNPATLTATWDMPEDFGPGTCNVFLRGPSGYGNSISNDCASSSPVTDYQGGAIDDATYQLVVSNGGSCNNEVVDSVTVSCESGQCNDDGICDIGESISICPDTFENCPPTGEVGTMCSATGNDALSCWFDSDCTNPNFTSCDQVGEPGLDACKCANPSGGYYAVEGTVWTDKNNDGQFNPGAVGDQKEEVDGILVTLSKLLEIDLTARTGVGIATGRYSFASLTRPGDYLVTVTIEVANTYAQPAPVPITLNDANPDQEVNFQLIPINSSDPSVTSFNPNTPTLTGRSDYLLRAEGVADGIIFYFHGSSIPTRDDPFGPPYNPDLTIAANTFYEIGKATPSADIAFVPPVTPNLEGQTYYLVANAIKGDLWCLENRKVNRRNADGSFKDLERACDNPGPKPLEVKYPEVTRAVSPPSPVAPRTANLSISASGDATEFWVYIKKDSPPIEGQTTVNATRYTPDLTLNPNQIYEMGRIVPSGGNALTFTAPKDPGTYYFAINAHTRSGSESTPSWEPHDRVCVWNTKIYKDNLDLSGINPIQVEGNPICANIPPVSLPLVVSGVTPTPTVCPGCPTSTPFPTGFFTPTPTRTPTPFPTSIFTPIPTRSPTPTPTVCPGCPTNTPAPTATRTPTPFPTGIFTPTPTRSPTPTPTVCPGCPTNTPAPTVTPGGPTSTPTRTPTPGGPTTPPFPTITGVPTVGPDGTVIFVSLNLEGFTGTYKPIRPMEPIVVELRSGSTVIQGRGAVNYSEVTRHFDGMAVVNQPFTDGEYRVLIKPTSYLERDFGLMQIRTKTVNFIPFNREIVILSCDLNNDDIVNILDIGQIYTDIKKRVVRESYADITREGFIDIFDHNYCVNNYLKIGAN